MSSHKRTQEEAEVEDLQAKRVRDEDDVALVKCGGCQEEWDEDDIFRCKDQDGKLWMVCPECNCCQFCYSELGDTDGTIDVDGNTYVVSRIEDGDRVFACGGDPSDDPLERGGCGAICDECGLVEANQLCFTDLACGRNLCSKHVGHECDRCDKNATAVIRTECALVDRTKFCTPFVTFDEEMDTIKLDDISDYSDDGDGRVFVYLNNEDDDIVSVRSSIYGRLMHAESAREKAGLKKK